MSDIPIRDLFAMHALQGMISANAFNCAFTAHKSYEYADAMLAVRAASQELSSNKNNTIKSLVIEHMVKRFLSWKLPLNFNPDGGISFEPDGNKGTPHEYKREPYGTNLFDSNQAKIMVLHLLEGLTVAEMQAASSAQPAIKEIDDAWRECFAMNCKCILERLNQGLIDDVRIMLEHPLFPVPLHCITDAEVKAGLAEYKAQTTSKDEASQ